MSKYVVIWKWKGAEQVALERLTVAQRNNVLPIFEVLPFKGNLTPKEQVAAAILQLQAVIDKKKLDSNGVGIGIDGRYLLAAGASILVVEKMCRYLQGKNIRAIPCIAPEQVILEYPKLTPLADHADIILRAQVRSTDLTAIDGGLQALKSLVPATTRIWLVLDMADMADVSPAAIAALVDPKATALAKLAMAHRIFLAGGSFPFSLAGKGPGTYDFMRKEWEVWTTVRASLPKLELYFGDYTVSNPKPMVIPEGAAIPALAQIRYALTDRWKLSRATAIKGKAGFAQYKQLCQLMLKAPYYAGKSFSFGDERINHHADPATTSGSPQTWRRDATSHHLVQTLTQLGWP